MKQNNVMKQLSAMQELIEWTNSLYKLGYQSLTVPQIESKATELLAKEKENTINFYIECIRSGTERESGKKFSEKDEEIVRKDIETYWNQTYKQK